MVSYAHVLVPTDGSRLAARAIPVARAVAERLGARTAVVGVASADREMERFEGHVSEVAGQLEPPDEVRRVVVESNAARGNARAAGDLERSLVCMSSRVTAGRRPEPISGRPSRRAHGPAGDVQAHLGDLIRRVARPEGPRISAVAVDDAIGAASGLRSWLPAYPAQLLVAATHARAGLPCAVVGSTAAHIVHAARCPCCSCRRRADVPRSSPVLGSSLASRRRPVTDEARRHMDARRRLRRASAWTSPGANQR